MRAMIERAQPYCWALAAATYFMGVIVLSARRASAGYPAQAAVEDAAGRLDAAFGAGVGQVWLPAVGCISILLPAAALGRLACTLALPSPPTGRETVRAISASATLLLIIVWLVACYEPAAAHRPPTLLGLGALGVSIWGAVVSAHIPHLGRPRRGPRRRPARVSTIKRAAWVLLGSQLLAMTLAAAATA